MRSFVLTALGALLLPGCPVDDRTLKPIVVSIGVGGGAGEASDAGAAGEEAGGAGDSRAGGGNAAEGGESGAGTGGSAATGGNGGTSGTGGAGATGGSGAVGGGGCGDALDGDAGCGGGPPFRCPDVDDNDVPDCDETIADNASFDNDASGWIADVGAKSTWDDTDAHGVAESGALGLSLETVEEQDGTILLGARQCFPVTGATAFYFGVEMSIPDAELRAGIQLLVYEDPLCSGDWIDIKTSPFTEGAAWSVARLTYFTPTTAKSVAMRLVAQKPFRASPSEVLFDNALVRAD
jgi:hypothetical protein